MCVFSSFGLDGGIWVLNVFIPDSSLLLYLLSLCYSGCFNYDLKIILGRHVRIAKCDVSMRKIDWAAYWSVFISKCKDSLVHAKHLIFIWSFFSLFALDTAQIDNSNIGYFRKLSIFCNSAMKRSPSVDIFVSCPIQMYGSNENMSKNCNVLVYWKATHQSGYSSWCQGHGQRRGNLSHVIIAAKS